jgi:pyridinium-3,5-bisthiocarboxylic acid mononucleotide nickel chelatase
MGRTIMYLDCFSGASGDMLLGALVDAGLKPAVLAEGLGKIGIAASSLSFSRQTQQGITGTCLTVHDDDNEHPVRNLPVVRTLLERSDLPQAVIASSLAIFTRIAEVEGAIHGISPEEVHFHELSALDSLVDIVGFNLALAELGIEAVFASPLPLGHGSVQTAHGLLPLPAPATLALLAIAQAPTIPSSANVELVTPTGAAILSSLAEFRQPAMAIQHVGYGLGHKVLPWANIVRVWIGRELDLPAAAHGEEPQQHHHVEHSH